MHLTQMSYLEEIARNGHRPTWWLFTVIPFLRKQLNKHLSPVTYSPPRKPTRIMDEDWDNLIVLDGCRYDVFEEVSTLKGSLEYRISLGSRTPEFLVENFSGETFNDTVYVTGNPMYRIEGLGSSFYDVIDVWEEAWDGELQTVPPRAMAEASREAYDRYPNKRILAHFMQPHYPFIGDLAEEIGAHAGFEASYRIVAANEPVGPKESHEWERDNPTVWELLAEGDVPAQLVWDAYKENLQVALPHVSELLEHFEDRTVVTSDHGNGFGERPFPFGQRVYGHPSGIRLDALCKVPWLVVENGARKNIIVDTSTDQTPDDSKLVRERLADLGYADL